MQIERRVLVTRDETMNISYYDYVEQNDSDQYYRGMCGNCPEITDTHTEIISPSCILKTTTKISSTYLA